MVELEINNKKIKFVSFSEKSHLRTEELTPLNNLKIDTSNKLTKWFFNDKQEVGVKYLQSLCLNCQTNLFSITTVRLIDEIKHHKNEATFICRACSCKENSKKVDIKKRNRRRKKNWDKKSEEEKSEFREAIRRGRLKKANITEEKIQRAIKAYIVDKER
jgi:hypothetical protein